MKKRYDDTLKFCCSSFKRELELHNLTGPNIRIIRIDKFGLPKNGNEPYNMFYLTTGYDNGEKNVPRRTLEYCPFCGEHLRSFYFSADYVNETNHDFIKLS